MNNYLRLTAFLFRCGLGNAGNGKKQKKFNGNWILYPFIGFCLLPLIGMLFMAGKEGYTMFASVGFEELLLKVVFLLGTCIVFFFGIAMTISIFFMTSDITALLPLPLQPWQIVAAKGTMAVVYEYYMLVLLLAPVLAGYGIQSGAGISFWVYGIVGILFLPVVPLTYASLLTMVVMRVFKGIRNKDLLSGVGLAFSIILAFGISFGMQMVETVSTDLVQMLQDREGMLNTIGMAFPQLGFLSSSLISGSIVSLLLYIVVSLVFVGIFLLVAQKIYLPAVIGMSESSSKKRILTTQEKKQINVQRNPIITYTWIELKRMFRTPVYLFNCALMPIIMPLVMIIPIFISFASSGITIGVLVPGGNILGQLRPMLREPLTVGIVLLVVAGMALFISSCNLTTGTCISREGTNYFYMKYIPMAYKEQLQAKVLSGVSLSYISIAIYIILIEGIMVVLGMNPLVLFLSLMIAAGMVLLVNYIQLFFDLMHPKLIWEMEAAAIKQNIFSMIGMMVAMIAGVIIGGAPVLLYMAGVPVYVLAVIEIVALAIMCFVLRHLVYAYGEKRLAAMED